MSIYDEFKQKNIVYSDTKKKINTKFIFEGNSAVKITVGTSQIDAAIVNRQEKDMCYLYTLAENSLSAGTNFIWNNLKFLILEVLKYTKEVSFIKYVCVLCNVDITEGVFGYFKSAEQKYINTSIKEDVAEFSQQKPILVAPAGTLSYGDKISFGGRP